MSVKGQGQMSRQEYEERDRFRLARMRARQANHTWELEFELWYSITRQPCHYCGTMQENRGLDRVDNNKEYESTNVVACCRYCNMRKSNESLEDFLDWVRRVYIHCIKIPEIIPTVKDL
jgi:hypothetical protein